MSDARRSLLGNGLATGLAVGVVIGVVGYIFGLGLDQVLSRLDIVFRHYWPPHP